MPALISAMPSHKSAKDFYSESNTHAIQNHEYEELHVVYPMLCFCDPDGPQKPCCCRPQGHRGQLPASNKFLWGWPVFSWYALKYLKLGYMKKFFTDDYPQASLGIIAFSSVLSVLVDAFTDPRMALWTDTLESKYGRRRPFVFFSAFFVPLVFILHWLPGIVGSGTAASVWFGIFHVAYKLADTVFMIPYDGWGAQLTPIYKEKTGVWVWRELLASAGILFGMAVVPLMFVTKQCSSTPEDGCLELPLIALFFGLIFMHACLQLAYSGKEPNAAALKLVHPVGRSSESNLDIDRRFSENDTVPMLMSSFLNRPFRVMLVTDMAKAVGQEIPFNVMPYMAACVLGEKCFGADDFFGFLVVANIICGASCVLLWQWLAAKTSKYHAYFFFNVSLALTTGAFVFLKRDTGDCTMSYITLLMTGLFGGAYGGSFLLKDLVCDCVDYDEFLSGGRRREASYIMAVEFIPKFMMIPGECLPFIMMAYFGYARPLKYRESCGPADMIFNNRSVSADQYCDLFYRSPSANSLCSNTLTCGQYVANGVSFVCNDVHQECGITQNDGVVWVLVLSFALVPFVCVSLGLMALYFYPKLARTEDMHEKLVDAIARLRRGETVEDPWRPGNFAEPARKATRHDGALSYFTPNELRAAIQAPTPSQSSGEVDARQLARWPLVFFVAFAALMPVGVFVIGLGFEDLYDDLGASVSPLGLMILGIGILGAWFHGSRLLAAAHLVRTSLRRKDVVRKYNQLCPFIGAKRLDLNGSPLADQSTQGAAPEDLEEEQGTSEVPAQGAEPAVPPAPAQAAPDTE